MVLLSVMFGLVGIVTKNANTIGLNHELHPHHHVYLKCEFGSVVKQKSKEDFSALLRPCFLYWSLMDNEIYFEFY